MSARAPLAFLFLVTPVVIESCLTAATPPSHWLNPGVALLLVLAYGPAILFMRELWVRQQLALPALFILGLVYGLFNEGILAHTLTQTGGSPVAPFVGYDDALGIHWAWASLLLPWHGFNSVVFMVLLTHLLFPLHSRQPWLSERAWRVLGVFLMLALGLYFIVQIPDRPAPAHAFFIYIPAMAALIALALKVRGREGAPIAPTRKQLWGSFTLGLLPHIVIVAAGFILPTKGWPLPLYFAFTGGVTALILWALARVREGRVLAFMHGGSLPLAIFTASVTYSDPVSLFTFTGYLALLIFSLRRLLAQRA